MKINAKGKHYQILNEEIRNAVSSGEKEIILDSVNGQRYIGAGLKGDVKITVNGVPGNDLGAFMDGPEIVVNANGQDGIGNTMNTGKIIVDGDAGDIAGHSMRGGKIYIKGDVGYRIGIHMKSYQELFPVVIAGGTARDFFGEYMAGGLLILLGIGKKEDEPIVGKYVGTGMHAGTIYIRGEVQDYQLGKEVKAFELNNEDCQILEKYIKEYCKDFSLDFGEIMKDHFVKLTPYTHRPYGKLYAY